MPEALPDSMADAGAQHAALSGSLARPADRIDSHLHVWELAPGKYSWLTPAHGVLYDSFTPEQAGQALVSAGVGQAILVQADDTAADTEAMLAAAAVHDWIIGVVGWLPLEDPSATAAMLEQWGSNPAFCGVRTLIHDNPRADILVLESVRASLALVAQAGIPFDVPDAFPRHLSQVADLAHTLPELTVVVDHLGKPPRAGTREQMRQWEKQLRAVATLPNAVAKFSGLHAAGTEYSAQALQQIWEIALDSFGPQRLMFGGDWPVSLLGESYHHNVNVAGTLINSLSAEEAALIWAGTARRTYRR
ncbi:amidohydrolase family protein [Arthrobacter sp. TMP15]|uniref:amidohydrolase family protein n=1 Tax=Arthrobacter sp. TMP15 TaxID=3140789 RepID=UPI0031BA53E1